VAGGHLGPDGGDLDLPGHDVRLSRQYRRLAGRGRPGHVPGRGRLDAVLDGLRAPDRVAGLCSVAYADHAPDDLRQLSDDHPLEGAPLPARAEHGVLPGRVRRSRRDEDDAGGAWRARDGDETDRRACLRGRLFRRCAGAGGDARHLDDAAIPCLVRGLCAVAAVFPAERCGESRKSSPMRVRR
jgi:hypothetical protein